MLLSNIRVIDFGRYIAGPYCGMMLADFGADVIRIDRRGGSEDRYLGPVAASGEGGMFLSINRNKRSLTLSPSQPGGRELIRRLVESADVVIANLPLAVMKKMGIDYDSLKAIKPDIILTMISTFGPDGPYAERVGFDAVAQAMSGTMRLTGFAESPVRALVPFEDYGTALHAAFGTMAALHHREKTGQGQLVDASLLATGVTFMAAFLAERRVTGIRRERQGNAAYWAAPSDVYKTKDGWVVVACNGGPMFARWAPGRGPRRSDRARAYAGPISTERDHRETIDAAMIPWCRRRTTQQVIGANSSAPACLSARFIPWTKRCAIPRCGRGNCWNTRPIRERPKTCRSPLRRCASRQPRRTSARAPRNPGSTTKEILAELGYAAEEIERPAQRRDGIVSLAGPRGNRNGRRCCRTQAPPVRGIPP